MTSRYATSADDLAAESVDGSLRPPARVLDPELRLQHALDLAFRYLGPRARTEVEMRRYLEGKRIEPETIGQALESLRRQDYLNDARFAREFAEDKRLLEEWGADRIERKLLALGVPVEIVRGAVDAQSRDDEVAAARALLARRFPRLDGDPREQRRAVGVLVRKGYDGELAWDVVRAHARGASFD
jgi:regulatory protein